MQNMVLQMATGVSEEECGMLLFELRSKEGVGKGKRDKQEDINNESVNRSGSFKVET